MSDLLFLIIAIPLASSVVLLVGGKFTDAWGHLLGTLAPIASFVLGLFAFFDLKNGDAEALHDNLYTWI